MTQLELLWEAPLGALSYLFSRLIKQSLTFISRYYNPTDTNAPPEWKVISTDFLSSPIKLLWTMSRARWNLHALIAIGGPFTLENNLSIDLASLNRSTPSWTAVIYTLKGYGTVTSTSSLKTSPDAEWETITLPPGRYLVGLRHYHWHNPVQLPTIKVDGEVALATEDLAAPPDFNQFYRNLVQRQGWIHQALNFYVYPLLQYRQWLPADFVRRTFLPVPNPETQFLYGAMRPGEALSIEVDETCLAHHELFLSLYNRACFPVDWYGVREAQHVTKSMVEKGAYIIRVHPKGVESPKYQAGWVKAKVL